jgi:hypothetical protein
MRLMHRGSFAAALRAGSFVAIVSTPLVTAYVTAYDNVD